MSNGIRFPDGSVVNGYIGTARLNTGEQKRANAALNALADSVLTGTGFVKMQHIPVEQIRSKYGNRKCVVDGITFDSEREGARYSVLARRQAAGEISQLQIQVPFEIVPAARVAGRNCRARVYIADFVYVVTETGSRVVEDSKGMLTPMYRLKRHLMKVVHNIDIVEV